MNTDTQLVTGGFQFTPFAVLPDVLKARDEVLAECALFGKVETPAQNEKSSAIRKKIRSLLTLFESQRKKLKEPILDAGRQLDRLVETERMELQKEDARLENLEKDFIRAELRRKAEEEELQRQELARIEAAKQAELKRIADEQAAAERRAREAALEAERLASEAKNKKQREAAEAARLEAERATRLAQEAAETARQQTQLAMERAEAATFVESRPVEISRAKGQAVLKKWRIERIDSFVLAKARPDLVRKIEFDMITINQELMAGVKLPGIFAVKDISISQRGGKTPSLIEV